MIWIANHLNYQRRWAYQIFTHIIQLAESFPVTVILFPHIQEIFSTYNLFNFENNWVIWVIAFSCLFVRTLKPWFPDTENKLFPDLWLALQAVVGLFVYSDGIKFYTPGQIYLSGFWWSTTFHPSFLLKSMISTAYESEDLCQPERPL